MIILVILKYIILFLVGLYLILIISGIFIKRKGQFPINQASLNRDDALIVTDKTGRKVEYFRYGSKDMKAPVMINIHGSGLDGTFEKAVHHRSCEALGVRGISISMPGVGNTDMKKGRQVTDWALEDLEAVLEAEQVENFMITGHSQGNPHALAAAFHFPERVIGLGLNAPLLPNDVTKEEGLKGALASDSLKTTAQMDFAWNAYWFSSLYIYQGLLAPWAPTKTLVAMGKNVKKDKELVQMMSHTFSRSMVRGTVGNTWESALDVCYLWGFDPRNISCKNISIWHASDDSACPPEIGAWMAKYYAKKGAHVNFKNDNIGYNHMTFCSAHYREPQHSLLKSLLDGIKK
ncbi:MAG: alpha/beta fold hydrolase [Flavobacteriaceae bacterium]